MANAPSARQPLRWSQLFLYGFLMLLFLALGAMLVELEVVAVSRPVRSQPAFVGQPPPVAGATGGGDGGNDAALAAEVGSLRGQLEEARRALAEAERAARDAATGAPAAAGSSQPQSRAPPVGQFGDGPLAPKDKAPLASKYGSHAKIVHVVSHTHWDREWYMSFEHYRRRFVWLLDDVMDRMKRFPELFRHFHMDGQVIPFVDYFEVRPTKRAEVLRAVKEGKLSIGPWYTAPDEFLASPEALVRNLQNGLRHCRRMGVEDEWTRIGYMADTFGHVSQIPQIYRLFGIDNAVFARGVQNPKAEMMWRGPDGSEVFCVYMTGWYCNAEGSPGSTAQAKSWLSGKVRGVASKSSTKHVLLMSGCDHTSFDPHILQNMEAANKASGDELYVHSNLEHYVETVQAAANKGSLYKHNGEMRAEIKHLSHINSNKITQKQANWECQTLLEHYAEPMRAMLWAAGAMDDYQSDYIWYAWEKILENHAHDSIGGCSVVEVHKDVDHRFYRCAQVARQLVDEALMALSVHATAGTPAGVAVFNTLGFRRCGETVVVRMDASGRVGDRPLVTDAETGEEVAAEIVYSEGSQWDYLLPNTGFRKPRTVTRVWVAFSTGKAGVPPLGHKTYTVAMSGGKLGLPEVGAAGAGELAVMENKHLRAAVESAGTLRVQEAGGGGGGAPYGGLCKLVVQDDRGDEYKSAAGGPGRTLSGAKLVGCKSGGAGQRCVVSGQLQAGGGGGAMEATVTYFLGTDARHVTIRVSVANHHDNFRLRAHFSPGAGASVSLADQHFDVVQRGLSSPGEERAQQDFVTLRTPDGKRGLTVGNRGLPGYEIEGGGTIAVTLLRATSKMSDWASFPTSPSSQEHGKQHFELSVAPYSEPGAAATDSLDYVAGSHELAHAFNVPLAAVHQQNYPGVVNSKPLFDLRNSLLRVLEMDAAGSRPTTEGFPPNPSGGGGGGGPNMGTRGDVSPSAGKSRSFVTVEPAAKLTVSSVKLSEPRDYTKADGGTLIVRWFNHGGPSVDARVCFTVPVSAAHLVNLREDRLEPLAVSDNCIAKPIATGDRQIRTVELEIKR